MLCSCEREAGENEGNRRKGRGESDGQSATRLRQKVDMGHMGFP